jgi:putative molybdopterin biosynthesis protein
MLPLQRLHTFEQLKIISDPRRLAILRHLMDAPATLTQLGKALGEHPAWVRHHVKVLEQVGLVEISEVKITAGYVEKYYQSVASAYLFQEMLLPEKPGKHTVVLSGSHDTALELLSTMVAGELYIYTNPIGSLDGLVALREGLCNATGCHLYDSLSGDYNTSYVRHFFPDKKITLLTLAHREQGLITPPGNPGNLTGIEDLSRPDVHFINRNPGSGTRLWLDEQLHRLGITPAQVRGYEDEASTHTAVANAVYAGRANVGLGVRAAAIALSLGFIPLFIERYDLVVPREQLEHKNLVPMFEAFYSGEFRRKVESLGGYDVSHLGDQIIF